MLYIISLLLIFHKILQGQPKKQINIGLRKILLHLKKKFSKPDATLIQKQRNNNKKKSRAQKRVNENLNLSQEK